MGYEPVQELLNAYPTLEDQASFLEYGPHGRPKQTFEGTIKKEGVEVDGKVYLTQLRSRQLHTKGRWPSKTPDLDEPTRATLGGTRRTHCF
jgi:hypothetical protein